MEPRVLAESSVGWTRRAPRRGRPGGAPLAGLGLLCILGIGAACSNSGSAADGGQAGATGPAGRGGAGGAAAGSGGAGAGGAGSGAAGASAAGASGGTAGARDAGGEDATAGVAGRDGGASAGTGGPSPCGPGKYILCESFETTAPGAVPAGWTQQGAATLSGVDATTGARGTHALKLSAAANGPRRIVFPAASFGAAHWGRIFYKVQAPAPKPVGGVVHSTLVALSGPNPQAAGSEEVRVVDTVEDTGGKHQFIYNVQPQGAEFGTGSDYLWRYDGAWHCAEWHIDAADQSYHFYFDGAEVTQIAKANGAGKFAGTGIPAAFTSMAVGWYNYQAVDPGFVAWIDEVAIDTNRIGCGG